MGTHAARGAMRGLRWIRYMLRSGMADKAQPVHMLFDQELLSRIDDFRFAQRFESRTAAIKWLLNWALSKKPIRKLDE